MQENLSVSAAGAHRPPRILVVDDDPMTLAIVETGLRKAGYIALHAESAFEALKLIEATPPDLAVLDISMPEMSGIELARRLRAETSIPFMFLTAHSSGDIVTQAIEEGAAGYIVKPVTIAQITPAVRAALARSEEIRRLRFDQAELHANLGQAQEQLVQSDKMASIGQLAAGVAHEINNPIGYVHSNIGTLEKYIDELFAALDALIAARQMPQAELERIQSQFDLPFLREDIPALLRESKEGIRRVRKIVQDLKDFSHVDNSSEWQWTNLHDGLESTLNIVNNEIKYKAEVVREFGDIPAIECLPGQINQVFMNLLVNAAHAIKEQGEGRSGRITVRTGCDDEHVWIEVEDNGCGIPAENLQRIFHPFFTTKPVGKGTGLGLSLSYNIVQKHGGNIDVKSEVGHGSIFRVTLPQRHTAENTAQVPA
jgi:signal transduction histidine kinase